MPAKRSLRLEGHRVLTTFEATDSSGGFDFARRATSSCSAGDSISIINTSRQWQALQRLQVQSFGGRLFSDVAAASMKEDVFPNPRVLDTSCAPREHYLHGDGSFKVLGEDLTLKIIAGVTRGIRSFNNIRRGSGQSGKLPRFQDKAIPVLNYAYLNENMVPSARPTSMILSYDVLA